MVDNNLLMEIGLVGKPNVGKSTFFVAATMATAEIASYPFTTIEANRGVGYVRAKCPHVEFGVECNPKNSLCDHGTRLIPVEIIDVAGLVPDAHKGRGLGNKFLDDLRQASALIHIVDASGGTDAEGQSVSIGTHDPVEDVKFLEREITYWIEGILAKAWEKSARRAEMQGEKLERLIHEKLTGLGISEAEVHVALKEANISGKPSSWKEEELLKLAASIRKVAKPLIIAANKCDIAPRENIDKLMAMEDFITIPTTAEHELALRKADRAKLVEYHLGASDFKILSEDKLNAQQKGALERIRKVMKTYNGTGVQRCLEEAVYNLLDMIVVYPVEDENHLTDKDGNVLPDAYLMRRGSKAIDLAYKVHTDLGDNFIRAIDARSKRVIGHDYELKDGDVIKIVAKA